MAALTHIYFHLTIASIFSKHYLSFGIVQSSFTALPTSTRRKTQKFGPFPPASRPETHLHTLVFLPHRALRQADAKKRSFRKYTYRGVDLEQLLDMKTDELIQLFPCRIRRKFQRGLKRKPQALIKKLRKAKKVS